MKRSLEKLLKISIFLASAAVIFYLLPREGQFKYDYQLGKPWNYGLIVAPFDFPMHKTDKELTAERDTLLKSYHPYYEVDSTAFASFNGQLTATFNDSWKKFSEKNNIADTLSLVYKDAIRDITSTVYNSGIMSLTDINQLNNTGVVEIVVVRSDYSFMTSISDLLTPRSAYEKIIFMAENQYRLNMLGDFIQRININNFLYSNLTFNQVLSEKIKDDLLSTISYTSGMVQTGERIVDKGEVISNETYKKLESYKKDYEIRLGTSEQRKYLMIGQVALIAVFLFMLYFFLNTYRKEILQETKDVLFILLNLLVFVALTAIVSRFFVSLELYVIPFAILAITLHTFFDSRVAIFVNIISVFICSFYAENPFDFAILHILGGTVATYSVRHLNRRGQLIRSSVLVFATYSVVYFALSLIQEGSLKAIEYVNFAFFLLNSALILFAYPLMFIYEKIFGYLSNVTLIELSDTNHELLQELSEKAPGTFQHSLMVASLSQEAARVLDANVLLTRVGAYFHDVGKMEDPAYFTENQAANYNPHEFLKPEESAKRIINHVENGVRLARKYSIPQPVIDFIRMHHGRGQTKFFLHEYAKSNPDKKVDVKLFSYPGPSPMTKETAILMMADAVEAASRSLEIYTDETISNLIEKIIDTQIEEGNFRYAPISFYEIEQVKDVFKKRLKIIYHSRVAYPSKEEMAKHLNPEAKKEKED